jgi:hypothetical protein
MGHLVNPVSFRLGISRYWNSKWVSKENLYHYKYLVKSDWNLFLFMTRFFNNKFCIDESFIFSHSIIVRSFSKTFIYIYFWDGEMLETLDEEIEIFFSKFNDYKILNRFFIIMGFFYKRYFLLFSFINRFKYIYLLIFLKIKLYLIKINKFFYNNYLNYNNILSLKAFYFFLKIYIKSKILLFKKIKYEISKFYKIKANQILLFSNINLFFESINKNYFFIKYLMTTFFFSLSKEKDTQVICYKLIRYFLDNFIVGTSSLYDYKVIMRPINRLELTSSFIGRYLSIRMRQRYRLRQALRNVLKDLRRIPIIEGYKIACSGRFTKKEIASYDVFKYRNIPTSTSTKHVDFISIPFILKYSLCNFKIWLCLNYSKLSKIDKNKHLYNRIFLEKTQDLLKYENDNEYLFINKYILKKKNKRKSGLKKISLNYNKKFHIKSNLKLFKYHKIILNSLDLYEFFFFKNIKKFRKIKKKYLLNKLKKNKLLKNIINKINNKTKFIKIRKFFFKKKYIRINKKFSFKRRIVKIINFFKKKRIKKTGHFYNSLLKRKLNFVKKNKNAFFTTLLMGRKRS